MNKIRFSPSTGCFYPNGYPYGDNLPPDLIEVDQADHDAAMDRPRGHTFTFIGGKLVISEPAPASFGVIAEQLWAKLRADRAVILERLPGFGFEALADGNKERADAVLAAIQALKSMPEDEAIVGAETEAELRAAIDAAFSAISTAAPAWLQSAFTK